MRSENKWKALITQHLRDCGALVLSLHGHSMQQRGWPDIYISHPKFTGWIELKLPSGCLSDAQLSIMRKLEMRTKAFVVIIEEDGRMRFTTSCGETVVTTNMPNLMTTLSKL